MSEEKTCQTCGYNEVFIMTKGFCTRDYQPKDKGHTCKHWKPINGPEENPNAPPEG